LNKKTTSNTYILFYLICSLSVFLPKSIIASGAYDKGTSAGKGAWDISFTLDPLKLIPYGQNYIVLGYGLSNTIDIVSYYSVHNNGQKSTYAGVLYQFINNTNIDLATAIGIRKRLNEYDPYDIFAPQLLYNFKMKNSYNIGGSIVNVININDSKFLNTGFAFDVALYIPLKNIIKIDSRITESYLSVGLFKNTKSSFSFNDLYFHYSIDFKIG